ncbi:MAG: hypothetical protein FVQ82_17245 [Planctomycetes bacterium]|nr:hypothetical protein [Planctomycetota bacterium]
MDAEHRHELKTNELNEILTHFPGFCKKHAHTIIGVALIIVAIISYFGFKSSKQKASGKQQTETTQQIQTIERDKVTVITGALAGTAPAETGFAKSALALELAAEGAKQPHSAAMALIKRGEALRAELHYTAGDVDKDLIDSNIKQAKEAYEQALIKAQGSTTLTAMAKYGLALCQEEIGDFTGAVEMYKAIAANEEFKGTIFPAQAQFRLDVMDDHKKQFKFVEAPKVTPLPGLDKAAMDALLRKEIHIEGAFPTERKPKDTTPPTEKPEDTSEKGKVYDVGPHPPKASDTEQK